MADLGMFAGNFLQSFVAAKQNKQQQEQQKKLNDMILKLQEQALETREDQVSALQEITSRMSGKLPTMQAQPAEGGLSEFARTGPDIPRPKESLTDMLSGSPDLLMRLSGNQFQNMQAMGQQVARSALANKVRELPEGSSPADFFQSPEGASLMISAGLPIQGKSFEEIDAMLRGLDIQTRVMELEDRQRDRERELSEAETEEGLAQASTEGLFHNIQNLADAGSILKDGGLLTQVGVPWSELRRNLASLAAGPLVSVYEAFGGSKEQLQAEITAAETFNKNAADISLALMDIIQGNVTDAKFNQLNRSLPSLELQWTTNAGLLLNLLDETIAVARAKNLDVDVESLSQLRQQLQQDMTVSGGGNVIRYDAQGNRIP